MGAAAEGEAPEAVTGEAGAPLGAAIVTAAMRLLFTRQLTVDSFSATDPNAAGKSPFRPFHVAVCLAAWGMGTRQPVGPCVAVAVAQSGARSWGHRAVRNAPRGGVGEVLVPVPRASMPGTGFGRPFGKRGGPSIVA